jgi:transcriptional regulator with XRE-family HTH domain
MRRSEEMKRQRTGKRIAKLRRAAGLSQQRLADACGLHRSQISNYERGAHIPGADALERLALGLKTTTDYLLGRTSDPSAAPLAAPAA